MPFKSEKQARMLRAAAHDPAFAKKVGVPMATAKKLVSHDKPKAAPKAKK